MTYVLHLTFLLFAKMFYLGRLIEVDQYYQVKKLKKSNQTETVTARYY